MCIPGVNMSDPGHRLIFRSLPSTASSRRYQPSGNEWGSRQPGPRTLHNLIRDTSPSPLVPAGNRQSLPLEGSRQHRGSTIG